VWAPEVPPGPHPLMRQFDICFPSLCQVPIDVTAGWVASPVFKWGHTHTHIQTPMGTYNFTVDLVGMLHQ